MHQALSVSLSLTSIHACTEIRVARADERKEEDKVGREVTTRILYIPWNIYHQDFPRWLLSRATRTRARRTSEGAKRASSRLSSAAISRSFSPPSSLSTSLSHPAVLFLERSLWGRENPAREKWRRRKCVLAMCCLFSGSSERKGSSHFAHFTPHVHVHLASSRIASNACVFIPLLSPIPLPSVFRLGGVWMPCNVGLMRLTTKSLRIMRHLSYLVCIFFNAKINCTSILLDIFSLILNGTMLNALKHEERHCWRMRKRQTYRKTYYWYIWIYIQARAANSRDS